MAAAFVLAATALSASGYAPLRRRPARRAVLSAERSATLGLGCFWAPSEKLLRVEGVRETAVGYAGGRADRPPTYKSVCSGEGGFVESVRVVYDDDAVDLGAVLDAALDCAAPVPGSRQYAPVVFVASAEERRAAEEWRARQRRRSDGLSAAAFGVEDLGPGFWRAEGYHQRYWQKWRPRYALLAALFLVNVLDPLQGAWTDAAAALTYALAALALGERFIDAKVVNVDEAAPPS